MLNSPTGGVLRGLVGIALFVLVPLSAAAQDPLTCRAWTDNPVVSGSTPLRAEHINEIRACLERIIQHLSVMPVDPVGDITVTDVVKVPCFNTRVCIYASFFNNTADEVRFSVWVSVHDGNDQVLWVHESGSPRVAAGGRERTGIFDGYAEWYAERGAAYYTIELTTRDGVPILCSGCGRRPW